MIQMIEFVENVIIRVRIHKDIIICVEKYWFYFFIFFVIPTFRLDHEKYQENLNEFAFINFIISLGL